MHPPNLEYLSVDPPSCIGIWRNQRAFWASKLLYRPHNAKIKEYYVCIVGPIIPARKTRMNAKVVFRVDRKIGTKYNVVLIIRVLYSGTKKEVQDIRLIIKMFMFYQSDRSIGYRHLVEKLCIWINHLNIEPPVVKKVIFVNWVYLPC